MVPKTDSEKMIVNHYRKLGYKAFKPSWPDFLMWNEKGEIVLVEGKRTGDRLSAQQRFSMGVLKGLGFKVEVAILDSDSVDGPAREVTEFDWHGNLRRVTKPSKQKVFSVSRIPFDENDHRLKIPKEKGWKEGLYDGMMYNKWQDSRSGKLGEDEPPPVPKEDVNKGTLDIIEQMAQHALAQHQEDEVKSNPDLNLEPPPSTNQPTDPQPDPPTSDQQPPPVEASGNQDEGGGGSQMDEKKQI